MADPADQPARQTEADCGSKGDKGEQLVRLAVGGWVRLALARGRTPAGPSVIATQSTNLNRPVAVTSPLTVTASLPGTAASVPIARRIVREALPGCPRAGDLMLTVTELVTNTIAHSASGQGGSFSLQLQAGPGWGRIEVTDEGPG